jgi:predicted amidohydrolase YtcJ
MKRHFCSFLVLISLCCSIFGQSKPIAFINAKIIPIIGEPIEQGILLIQNGKITAVGDAQTIKLTSDVQVIDLNGKIIMPGLVDSHSHIGEPAGADGSAPIQPDVRILDSLNPRASSALNRAELRL